MRIRLTPLRPGTVNEPFTAVHSVQRGRLALVRERLTHRPLTLRPVEERSMVNRTDPGADSVKLTVVPMAARAAWNGRPNGAARNTVLDRRMDVIFGGVIGVGVGVAWGVGVGVGTGVGTGVGVGVGT